MSRFNSSKEKNCESNITCVEALEKAMEDRKRAKQELENQAQNIIVDAISNFAEPYDDIVVQIRLKKDTIVIHFSSEEFKWNGSKVISDLRNATYVMKMIKEILSSDSMLRQDLDYEDRGDTIVLKLK